MQSNTMLSQDSDPDSILAAKELPFTLQDLKAAIPDYCFTPSTWRSISYLLLDLGIITGLYVIAHYLDSWYFFPLFWIAQGTMFWALFVVGHDCGHGSFSKQKWLNNLVGHLCHIPILVPYHGWRISHRTHHGNTGNLETDESWYPISETNYQAMDGQTKLFRFHFFLLAYPLYLFTGAPNRPGSHFLPSSSLFRPSEKWDVCVSSALWLLMVAFLGWLAAQLGWIGLVQYYLAPYLVFIIWLDLVTYLHHTSPEIPWYRSQEWYFLKGALSTIDRDYGFFNPIHHHIGTHVAHHIFLKIPHYHLKSATEAIKPVLGKYYRQSNESIWKSLINSYRTCHFVSDLGSQVFYKSAWKRISR
jgi:omega-3 fatty acid desaturase (delta-15 desaturase)